MNTANYAIIRGTKYANGPAMLETSEAVTPEVSPMLDNDTPNDNLIPYGYCHCGCGNKTRLATRTTPRWGHVKGEPYRFISGHKAKRQPIPLKWDSDRDCFLLTLTSGEVSLVDADDADRVGMFRWHRCKDINNTYALRTDQKTRKTISLHRFIMNAPSNMSVDHINGDGLDNRRSNLRIASRSENRQNARKVQSNNTSGYTGVYLSQGKWKAAVGKNGRKFNLGSFACPIEAAIARDVAALELHGEFASLNFPRLKAMYGAKVVKP